MNKVAPFAGAWIEIAKPETTSPKSWSLPSRERGLKSDRAAGEICKECVAPFAGAWIEIAAMYPADQGRSCRSLRGSVD